MECNFEIIGFPQSLESITPETLTKEQLQNIIRCKADLKVVARTDRTDRTDTVGISILNDTHAIESDSPNWRSRVRVSSNWSLVNENEPTIRSALSSPPLPPTPFFQLDSALPVLNNLEAINQEPVFGITNATQDHVMQDATQDQEFMQDLNLPIVAEPLQTQGTRVLTAEKIFMYALGKEVIETERPSASVFLALFLARVHGNDSNNSVPDTLTQWPTNKVKNFFNNHRKHF